VDALIFTAIGLAIAFWAWRAGYFSRKQRQTIHEGAPERGRILIPGMTPPEVLEYLRQYFSLDFPNSVSGNLEFAQMDDGFEVWEDSGSAGLLIVHLVLTVITFGLWLVVWIPMAMSREANRNKVGVHIEASGAEAGGTLVWLEGSDTFKRIVESHLRRQLALQTSGTPGGPGVVMA
jgi:hypothetical protein